ncbi:myb/SANT-like DNA-binding domain-containing protein 3 [Amblyomma americanum]
MSLQSSQDDSCSQRRPAPRFTFEEKEILLGLVKTYQHVLECKKTDVSSLAKKNATWKEIAGLFNSHHGVTRRDPNQLKKCWANMKQKSKGEDATKKRDRHKTGGGPAKCHVSALSEQVMAVASHISTRAGNATDSDGGIDLPPVASLPVIRLLQPMVDEPGDAECHYSDKGCIG